MDHLNSNMENFFVFLDVFGLFIFVCLSVERFFTFIFIEKKQYVFWVQVPCTTHFASVFRIIIGDGHISDLQNAIIEQGV